MFLRHRVNYTFALKIAELSTLELPNVEEQKVIMQSLERKLFDEVA